MSGELQTIPARHGVATFVPRGRTIKIINTYGKQVISTWAFGLHAPPEEGDDEEEGEDDIEETARELKEEIDNGPGRKEEGVQGKVEKEIEKPKEEAKQGEAISKEIQTSVKDKLESRENEDEEEAGDPPEQAPDTLSNEKTTESTDPKQPPQKRTWSSYLPSIPYRNRGNAANTAQETKSAPKTKKAQNEAASKKWSSYLPTGKGFSSYVPNVQMPDSKELVSAFKASHYRDPNKSYAEQLYDFSKTPVGAGSLAAASGSGTASSLYAAYNAYTKLNPLKRDQPPMEYLSLPHTRASTHRLVPEVDDTLLTNLRNPIMTLVEDTTPGAHDTLTAACDANLYASLGVDKPEEHGSCAENLVLALKELNEKAGLKGTKAVGADITVNIAPTPLHLFMNTPLEFNTQDQSDKDAGAKGATLKVEEPKGKKRSYVRFKAERDMVVVLSACPMDVGSQNGGRCMAANFMVEEAEGDDLAASTPSLKKSKATPKKNPTSTPPVKGKEEKKPTPRPRGGPQKAAVVQKSAANARKDSGTDDPPESGLPNSDSKEGVKTGEEGTPKPKKKPKKLERRSTPAKSEAS